MHPHVDPIPRLYINAATSDLIKGGSVGNYRPITPTK